jgi:site-specific DNA recombinase
VSISTSRTEPVDQQNADQDHYQPELILIPWSKPPAKKFREVIQPATSAHRIKPIRAERRAGLIRSIARGRQWLDEIVSGTTSIDDLASRHNCSARQINITLSMAFLAPSLVKAAIEGRLPRGLGIAELRDAPAEWSQQATRLGQPHT